MHAIEAHLLKNQYQGLRRTPLLIERKMEFKKITTPVVVEQIDDTIAKDCISVTISSTRNDCFA
jgi:hypothetical protein